MSIMKESGSAWIGAIPDHWEMTKLGSVYEERSEKVNDTEYMPLSVTMSGIVPQLDSAVKSDSRDNRKLIRKNDFVINSRSDRRGAYGVSPYDGSCSLINIVLQPRDEEEADYYKYVLHTPLFPDEFYRWGSGIVSDLWSTRWENMKRILVPKPSKDEMKTIVKYLDKKCNAIDLAIEKEQALIENLLSYKQALIDKTTSQGIKEPVAYKESGYPWLSRIPEHWEMLYSKKLFSLRKDKAHIEDVQLTSSQKYGIITQEEFMQREGRQVMQVVTGEDILKHVEAGDFVISMRSFQGGLEYSEISGKISSAYVMLIPNPALVVNDYYKWLFKSTRYIKALQSTSNLVRDGQALRFSNFAQVYLPHFSKEEQAEIGEFLNTECEKIMQTISLSETMIEKLKKYKKGLIYEYVTGKKEVPWDN